MRFLVTPNSELTSKAILTDDYDPVEIANNVHIRNIKQDLQHLDFGSPVRLYAIVDSRPPKTYTLLS